MSYFKPGLEAASTFDIPANEEYREYQQVHKIAVEEAADKGQIEDSKSPHLGPQLGDWFASRRNIPLRKVSIFATPGSSDCGGARSRGFVKDEEEIEAGEEVNQAKSQGFLKHITISRDQTKERKNLEEQLALQVLLDKSVELSLEALCGDIGETTRGSRGVEDATSFGTEHLANVIRWRGGIQSAENKDRNWTPEYEYLANILKVDERGDSRRSSLSSSDIGTIDSFEKVIDDSFYQDMLAGIGNDLIHRHSDSRTNKSDFIPSSQASNLDSEVSLFHRGRTDVWSISNNHPRSTMSTLRSQKSRGDEHPQGSNNDAVNKATAVRDQIEELTARLEYLKGQLGEDAKPSILPTQDHHARPWKTIYRIKSKSYLGKPEWVHGDERIKLGASMPLMNVTDYLDRHPELLFLVLKDYTTDEYPDNTTPTDEFCYVDVLPPPVPDTESIFIASRDMRTAIEALIDTYPDFDTVFPDFSLSIEIPAPYFFLFHMFPQWKDKVVELEVLDQERASALFKYLEAVFIPIYEETIGALTLGTISGKHIQFLVKPGDILIQPNPIPHAFMATSWATPLGIFVDKRKNASSRPIGGDNNSRKRPGTIHKKDDFRQSTEQTDKGGGMDMRDPYGVWAVTGWNWVINEGRLYKNDVTLELRTDISSTKLFNINDLNWFPLQYASEEIKSLLLERGQKFWRCRTMQFVGYLPSADSDDAPEGANERFVIDFATYRKLHTEPTQKSQLKDEERTFDTEIMAQEMPPQDKTINLLPSTVIGYNLRLKKWVDIEVDRIQEVDWNKKAFENLVVDEETKHLVKALISNQINAEKSTDLIRGKGNGLIMLLHGGPGTGKTFTAESVAEMAEKPLYRVTCGDIGTKPEAVEKYLESVLLLGKIWGCVVLLDEADVFLEERSLTDLKRNALVSVFLRILEYYDGILILTSNRVGTFDQAFRSRIQLALHYENLTKAQRRKIWRNFFNRLKDLGEQTIDFDDLYDHIDELAEHDMNGRQIRNSITTARQLAQFECKDFSSTQLKHAIKVAGKFEGYLKGVNQGFSDDQLARDSGFR